MSNISAGTSKKSMLDTRTLPPFPAIASKLQEMMRNNEVDIKKITDLVSSDVSLVTQILRIVNSAFYGLSREVTNLRFAIAFLGINEINRIVLSLSVVGGFEIKNRNALKGFWRHSFYTALATKKLAKTYARLETAEDLWACSLLHDLGKLVYMQFCYEDFAAIEKYAIENGIMFSEAEDALGLEKSEGFGVMIADHWQLPKPIRDACENHTLASLKSLDMSLPSAEFYRIIALGNLFSELNESEHLTEETRKRITDTIMEKTGIDESTLITHLADTQVLRFEVDEFMKNLF